MSKNAYQEVYPFTTENIQGYMKDLDMKDKEVLTVGSSLDQAYNALALGAKKVKVLDINKNTKRFCELKSNLILTHKRKELYAAVMCRKSLMEDQGIICSNERFDVERVESLNYYMQNEETYRKLRQRLREQEALTIVEGNIFEMDKTIGDEKFDRIFFSNVLQMLDYFKDKKESAYDMLEKHFPNWKSHLNSEGILQLFYLYSFAKKDVIEPDNKSAGYDLSKVVSAVRRTTPVEEGSLDIAFFESCTGVGAITDAAVLYTKRR